MTRAHNDFSAFIKAYEGTGSYGATHQKAVDELTSGNKKSCWSWYVLPQLAILPKGSPNALTFAIHDIDEAKKFLQESTLFQKYDAMIKAVHKHLKSAQDKKAAITKLVNEIDTFRFISSVTLFEGIAKLLAKDPSIELTQQQKYSELAQLCRDILGEHPGIRCSKTLGALNRHSTSDTQQKKTSNEAGVDGNDNLTTVTNTNTPPPTLELNIANLRVTYQIEMKKTRSWVGGCLHYSQIFEKKVPTGNKTLFWVHTRTESKTLLEVLATLIEIATDQSGCFRNENTSASVRTLKRFGFKTPDEAIAHLKSITPQPTF